MLQLYMYGIILKTPRGNLDAANTVALTIIKHHQLVTFYNNTAYKLVFPCKVTAQ
jgi:hypothetical protein